MGTSWPVIELVMIELLAAHHLAVEHGPRQGVIRGGVRATLGPARAGRPVHHDPDRFGDGTHDLLGGRVAQVDPAGRVGDEDGLGHHVDDLPQAGQPVLGLRPGRLLLHQVLGPHVGRDGAQDDPDALPELVQEGDLDVAEILDRCELDHGPRLVLEQDGEEDDGSGRRAAERR